PHDKTPAVVFGHDDLDVLTLGPSKQRARESTLFAYPYSAFILEPHADKARVTGTHVRQPEVHLPMVGGCVNVAWVDSDAGRSSVPKFAPLDGGLQRGDDKR